MVSTRWCNSSHISSFARNSKRNVPWACCLLAWWHRVARCNPLRFFFLWGYLKAHVYQHRPQTFEGLKEVITQEVAATPPETTCMVMEKYRERLNQCIDNEGATWVIWFLNYKTALCILFKNLKKSLSCLVWFLLASQIGKFFLPHPVHLNQLSITEVMKSCRIF
jgi:hypothetical protein